MGQRAQPGARRGCRGGAGINALRGRGGAPGGLPRREQRARAAGAEDARRHARVHDGAGEAVAGRGGVYCCSGRVGGRPALWWCVRSVKMFVH